MDLRIFLEQARCLLRKRFHAGAVLEDRPPLAMLGRNDAAKTLQHLVALEKNPAVAKMIVGENRAPDRMGVQHRAGAEPLDDCYMQQRLRGRLSRRRFKRASFRIHLEDVIRHQPALIEGARRDRDAQWIVTYARAEVPAGSKRPASPVKFATELDQMFRCIHPGIIIGSVSTEKVHGRGASSNPRNRFETMSYETSEWDEPGDPSRHTTFLKDETRSIINYNDSPD